jgi:FSR family fosmidomycin resistance protein-like MFS transporter
VLAAAAPGAIAGNGFAIASDYLSRRVIAAGGAFGFAGALALFALGDSFATLAFASFLYGMAATAMIDASEVALVDVAGDDLAPTLARTNLLGALGDVVGPLLVLGAIAFGFGWRAPFVIAVVALVVYGVCLARAPLPTPTPVHDRDHPARALLNVVRDGRVLFFAVVALLLGPLDESFLAFLIAFAQEERSLSPSGAICLALCCVSGSVVGFARCSVRHTGPVATLTRPAAVMAVSAAVMAVVPIAVLIAPAAFGFGYGLAAFWNTAQARMLQLRPGQTGTVKAVVTTIEFAGFGLPIAYGAVADRFGVAAGFGCYVATAVALLVLVSRAPRATTAVLPRV